jgi:hypothetical protein
MKYAQFRSKQILLFQITEQTTFYAKPYRDRKKGIKIILLTFHSIISSKTYSSQRLSCLSRFPYVVLATKMVTFFFAVALRPNAGHVLILDVSRSHTTTHHSR